MVMVIVWPCILKLIEGKDTGTPRPTCEQLPKRKMEWNDGVRSGINKHHPGFGRLLLRQLPPGNRFSTNVSLVVRAEVFWNPEHPYERYAREYPHIIRRPLPTAEGGGVREEGQEASYKFKKPGDKKPGNSLGAWVSSFEPVSCGFRKWR